MCALRTPASFTVSVLVVVEGHGVTASWACALRPPGLQAPDGPGVSVSSSMCSVSHVSVATIHPLALTLKSGDYMQTYVKAREYGRHWNFINSKIKPKLIQCAETHLITRCRAQSQGTRRVWRALKGHWAPTDAWFRAPSWHRVLSPESTASQEPGRWEAHWWGADGDPHLPGHQGRTRV